MGTYLGKLATEAWFEEITSERLPVRAKCLTHDAWSVEDADRDGSVCGRLRSCRPGSHLRYAGHSGESRVRHGFDLSGESIRFVLKWIVVSPARQLRH